MSSSRYRYFKKLDKPKVMDKITKRAKNYRIRDDVLYIRQKTEGSIIYAWDTEALKTVVMTRRQWQESDPAITKTESCILMNMSDTTFEKYRKICNLKTKKGKIGYAPEELFYMSKSYFSIEDLCLIVDSVAHKKNRPSSYELRELFRLGYISYKQTKTGEWIPTWDESIF